MFFLFICHHMMNQKWTRNINKGKYSFLRIWQIILVIFLFMLGSMISGIILSRYGSCSSYGKCTYDLCILGICDDGITSGVPLEHVYKYDKE